ncbi:MAG: DUF6152 family protein [Pseudomonadales bacterium]|nr:DUF6152 family protein [Pseudomonadales bacterium]
MSMLKKISGPLALVLLAALAQLSSAVALAHHSFAMFDHEKQIKMTGTVSRFQWTNPHVYIEMDVADVNGESKRWTIECANPGILSRVGWKFNIIKPGDEITVIVGPLRTGEPGALLKQVTLANGIKMGNGGPAGEPNIE